MSGLLGGLGIVGLWCLNFGISWFNAWAAGKGKIDAHHKGGWPVLVHWATLTMSAAGFTWCYLVIAAVVFGSIPMGDPPTPILGPTEVEAMLSLGYLVVILPILGSGLAITIDSWGHFYRKRTLGSGAVTAWNTYAQVSNAISAARNVPDAFGKALDAFDGDGDSKGVVVLILVALALAGGIITTTVIYRASATTDAIKFAEGRRARETTNA